MLDFCLDTLASFVSPGSQAVVGAAKAVHTVSKAHDQRVAARHAAELSEHQRISGEYAEKLADSQKKLDEALSILEKCL